jgi:dienelactone hydrolase
MRRLLLFAPLFVVGCSGGDGGGTETAGKRVEVTASDGTKVNAEFVKGGNKGVVLMFHQAGSNLHEYDPIAPRIASLGWDCLKVDQRAGGDMWGHDNLTRKQFTGETHYWDAYADMEAALAWAEDQGYKRIVAWGSSYSASLVLRLASEHESVDAVVSFSPGEYFDEKGLVAGWNSMVTAPCFFAATSEEFLAEVYAIIDTKPKAPGREKDLTVGTKDGVHGSSALRADKNPKDAEKYWEKLELFFKTFESGGAGFGGK